MNARTRSVSGLMLAASLGMGAMGAIEHLPEGLLDGASLERLLVPVNELLLSAPPPTIGTNRELQSRVDARSKMGPRLGAMVAAGESRRLRVEVALDPALTAGRAGRTHAEHLVGLGGQVVADTSGNGRYLIDVAGDALDAFALAPQVRRLAFVAVVTE